MSDTVLSGSPFETLDARFASIINRSARLERLATGCRSAEGPAYFPAGRYLVWSDVPNDRMLRWDECDGHVSEGRRQERELDGCHVYRVDPGTAEVRRVADDFSRPNGLAFSPDESRLYIADSGATHEPDGPRHIRAFDVLDGRTLSGGDVFAACESGIFDGFRFDEAGRLWTSAEDGVHCFETDGTLIGKIRVPERVANVCFGGAHRNRLFITATTSLYSVYLLLRGARTI